MLQRLFVAAKRHDLVAGLPYWKQDLWAGFMLSFIAMAFCLAIAPDSGAPPIAGLISAIIAGLVLPMMGGSYVTISGPAAALAPVLLAYVLAMGHGSTAEGYPLLCAVILMAGCLQLVLWLFKAARLCKWIPEAAIDGMLAAIGFMIIAKQLPKIMGIKFESHEALGMVVEAIFRFPQASGNVLALAIICLVLIFGLTWLNERIRTRLSGGAAKLLLPPAAVVLFVGVVGGILLGLDSHDRIQVPGKVFDGITLPNFAGILDDPSIWWMAVQAVFVLAIIDMIESVATVRMVDKLDPLKRTSKPNRTLAAMGVSNILSSCLGGITIIPGGVKSTANVHLGGKSQWANLYCALVLIAFLLWGKDLINLIPYSALAAILIFLGCKMILKAWKEVGFGAKGEGHRAHTSESMWIQRLVCVVSITITITVDLMWGIITATVVHLFFSWLLAARKSSVKEGVDIIQATVQAPLPMQTHVTRDANGEHVATMREEKVGNNL